MKSLWNEDEARGCGEDPLLLRVYTSRLLGRDPALVLHGGGNTSVKAEFTDRLGERHDVLYVKGSGWNLETIEPAGFAPVKLGSLQRMSELDALSDREMVALQRAAMLDASAPNPSVEAILHAIIPFRFVDHTHADAVVLITNTPGGERHIRDIYGDRVLVIPYVMPGFVLAKKVWEMTRSTDWSRLDGMVLLGHGVFTFADTARTSYEHMIGLVTQAEAFIADRGVAVAADASPGEPLSGDDLLRLARLRRLVAGAWGAPTLAVLDDSAQAVEFSRLPNVADVARRGPLTPDHVIRTKPVPLVLSGVPDDDVGNYVAAYASYFDRHQRGELTMLDPAPRWAVWPGRGTVSFARRRRDIAVLTDITRHTVAAIRTAEAIDAWTPLPEKDIFDVEYWELEQAKLSKTTASPPLLGKVALVTGAAGGIGRACVLALAKRGASVIALDRLPTITSLFSNDDALGIQCDVTDEHAVREAVESTVRLYGGLDIVVSNAGSFPPSTRIAHMTRKTWEQALATNLTSHQLLLQHAAPFLEMGIDAAVIIVGSKNVPAPGPGASAYSVSKAGLTQLARVAALEFGASGIRVNVVHPNNVFDTGIWTDEVLKERAGHYGLTVEQYKKRNVLGVEVRSADVAELVCAMAGPAFAKTTGAQVPIDGGNERVI